MQDLRYGARTLRRSPGYAFAAILTLGLGIGANSAMFSVINGTLLHPLPYRDSGRLIRIRNDAPLANRQDVGVSIAETRDLRQRLASLESFVEYHQMHFVLLNQGEPHRVNTGVVSSQYFDVFGIRPELGRMFAPSDDVMGAEPVLILSHAFWQKQFGSDPQVIGKVVQMNDHDAHDRGRAPGHRRSTRTTTTCTCRRWRVRSGRRTSRAATTTTGSSRPARVRPHEARRDALADERRRAGGGPELGAAESRPVPAGGDGLHDVGGLARRRDHAQCAPDAVRARRHDGAGAVHRVRERREPVALAHAPARSRARAPFCARRQPPAARTATAHREHSRGVRGSGARSAHRMADGEDARGVREPVHAARDRRRRSTASSSASRCPSRS